MNDMASKEYLSIQELRHYLGISQAKAYQLTRSSGFPICRIGRLIRIPRKGLQAWLEGRTAVAGEEEQNEHL